jgi:formyl-CoA transferase
MIALNGIRVLDLSKVLAGPLCGQYLGSLAQKSSRLNRLAAATTHGHGCRRTEASQRPSWRSTTTSAACAVDLKTAEGRQIVQTLAAKSDVVLQGFGSGAAARLGVDYKTLSGMNPSLICARFPDTEERGH